MKTFQSLASFQTATTQKIDIEKGIIYGVVLACGGKNKNGTYFTDEFLNDLAKQGNEKGEIKSRFGHPTMCASALGTYIGDYKNFSVKDNKLYGDLHLSSVSKKVNVPNGGISMYDYVLEMAQNHSKKLGNSIVVYADYEEISVEDEKDKDNILTALKLIDFAFSDLVDDPAATDSLFHSAGDLGTSVGVFLDNHPEVFEVLEKNPQIVADFLERYLHSENHKKEHMKKINVFEKIKKALKASFDVDLTLANGDIITVVTEEQTPKEGDAVKQKTDNGQEVDKPLSDGEYLLKDERTLVVKDGKIAEIKEKSSESDPEKDKEATSEEFEALGQLVLVMFDRIEKLENENRDLTKKYETLAKSVKSDFSAGQPSKQGANNPTGNETKKVTLEEIRARREMYKQ